MNLDQIGFSRRILHALMNSGIHTLDQLIKALPKIDSSKNRGIGRETKIQIIRTLFKNQLLTQEQCKELIPDRGWEPIKKGRRQFERLTIQEIMGELEEKEKLEQHYRQAKELCVEFNRSLRITMALLKRSNQWIAFRQGDYSKVVNCLIKAGSNGLGIGYGAKLDLKSYINIKYGDSK